MWNVQSFKARKFVGYESIIVGYASTCTHATIKLHHVHFCSSVQAMQCVLRLAMVDVTNMSRLHVKQDITFTPIH